MPELRVADENRPSFLKYAVFAFAGILLVSGTAAYLIAGVNAPGAGLVAGFVAGGLNLGLLFLLIQSLIEEWVDAVEVVEE